MGSIQMLGIAQGFLAYELTGSNKILGILSASSAFPMLLFSPIGGAIADRVERRKILQLGQAISACMTLGMGLLVLTGTVTWYYLIGVGFIQTSLWAFIAPARQSLVPMLVPKELLSNAMGISGAGMSLGGLVAPALGGMIYSILGPAGVYLTISAIGFGALTIITSLPSIPGKPIAERKPIFGEIRAGIVYVYGNKVVRTLLFSILSISMLSAPLFALMPALIVDAYGRESAAFGIMISIGGIGSLLGALSIAYLGIWRRGLLYLTCGLVCAITMLAISASPWFYLSVAAMMFMGLGSGTEWSLKQAIGMGNTADAYRGRVMSIFMLAYGLTPLSTLPAGVIADIIGTQTTVGIFGGLLLIIAVCLLATQKQFRQLQ